MKETPASDLERRKKVRLRVRPDLQVTPQKYEGRTYYVVKDPVSLRYYRFKEQEHFLIRQMDGGHTLDDAQKAFEKRFRPDRLTLEDLEHFGQQLLTAGLAQNESPQAGQQLFDRRKKRRRREILQAFTNILYIKLPIFDPDRLLTRMLPYLRWIFTTWFLLFSVGVMLGAVFLVLTHFQSFLDRLPSYHEFFSFKTVIYLWAALGIVKVIHEFGHGLSCKAFGGEVHEMGLLFLCLSPCMYCNVSDAWTLPSKWKRIIISFAGIYVELMIAAVATFIWWNTPASPFVNHMSLCLMVVCSVSTVVFNGNPLMRYDGYYILADWLEIPNLRDRSNRYLQRIVMDHCLGIEVQPEPYMERWRRILFVTYAITSYIYRWVITFVILKFMATFLKPYKLEIISNLLALLAVGSMIGWPLFRLGQNLYKRGRLPDMKPVRVTLSSCVLAGLILAFFFLPLPVSRVRQSGLVQVQPQAMEKVPVVVPGRLERVAVKEGQYVKKGAILAEFTSQKLAEDELKLRAQLQHQADLARAFEAELARTTNSSERDTLTKRHADAVAERRVIEQRLATLVETTKRLTLVAPTDGYVMGLPKIDELYKTWEVKDLEVPFCSIGDPRQLRVLVPVSPADYDLVRADLRQKRQTGEPLEVTIRVSGLAGKTWQGKVVHLPQSADRTVPLQLSTRGGGPLAVKPTSQPNALEPQAQVYLVGVHFINPDSSIAPGTMAQVKIHVEYHSLGWWAWRSLSQTFDLGLL
ncbi:MAG: efflux RND transporter periplasmic adaptor subunit [Gemmataceae bacterium]|nr:efflux RND transporter periplasmic adaptor subunit [Gemmataceae bacterium]